MTPSHKRLTRERVLRAAIALADERGIESLSMRKLAASLGVEAMSLYNHVANKDDLVDGIVETVVAEFALPPEGREWRVALGEAARSTHETLLRHPWAAALIESRVTPTPVRFRHADAILGTLRRAGFPVEVAYRAQLTIDSYVYGFTLQEVSWPFAPEQQREVAATLRPYVDSGEYRHLTEMIEFLRDDRAPGAATTDAGARESDFDFGLELILDGLERLRP